MTVQYLVQMCVIYMLLKIFSAGLGIAVPVLIFQVFRMTNRSHPCCLHLADSATTLLMLVSASPLLWYSFLRVWKRYAVTRFLTGTGNALLPVFFDVGLVGLEPRLVLIISSDKMQKNTLEIIYVVATL